MRGMRTSFWSVLGLLVLVIAAGAGEDEKPTSTLLTEPHELVGEPAEEWEVEGWIHSEPLSLETLRGKVILVRWWTAPSCPYCRASAPALQEFHRRYEEEGLVVVGLYHHKSSRPLKDGDVERYAEILGFEFPVALDPGWETLRRWWLDRTETSFTSVSFLLDRKGVVRAVHPGGQYVEGDGDYESMQELIEELLAEPHDE
jgi:thiol-disulfide isomerase/thioredoxin